MNFLFQRRTLSLLIATAAINASCIAAMAQPAPPTQTPIYLPTVSHDIVPLEMGADGKLIYRDINAQGDKILDFSHCGYGGGGVALPDVAAKITVAPDADDTDDTPRMQAAIDEVSKLPLDANGFRGAVLFRRGQYEMADGVKVSTSGVVLRGEGGDENGDENGTVFFGTGTKPYSLASFAGEAMKMLPETEQKITDDYVPLGSTRITVTDGANFKVGDTILVIRHGNAAWIHEIKMDQISIRNKGKSSETKQWTPFDLKFDRVITAVDGNALTIDAPLGNSIARKWGGGSVVKYDGSGRISQVGIENIFASNLFDRKVTKKYGDDTVFVDENHVKRFVAFDNACNVWARNLGTRYIEGVVSFGSGVKHGTVQDCTSVDPVSQITGGRRYPYFSNGQLTFWQRLRARDSRHAFAYSSRVPGPNVFLDCEASDEHANSEAHHRWSVGGLYDNVRGNVAVNDRGNQGSGHGWGGANYVIWNGEGRLILQSPPTAENFAFGFVGTLGKPFRGPVNGWFVSLGQHVAPRSLYLQQLQERLGTQAVKNTEPKANDKNAATGARAETTRASATENRAIPAAVGSANNPLAVTALPAKTSFDLYLLMGQSNMSGRDTSTIKQQITNPHVLALNGENQWFVAKDPIHEKGAGIGPGIPFALEMLRGDDATTIGLIPCAVGGTPLSRWVKGGDLYEKAIVRARAAQANGTLKGVLWHQGESDTRKQGDADSYQARLTRMFADLRADLGQPNVPIVVGQLGTFLKTEKFPYAETVRGAIQNVSETVPNVGFADSIGLEDKGDVLHFSAAAQGTFGARYAAAMKNLQKTAQ